MHSHYWAHHEFWGTAIWTRASTEKMKVSKILSRVNFKPWRSGRFKKGADDLAVGVDFKLCVATGGYKREALEVPRQLVWSSDVAGDLKSELLDWLIERPRKDVVEWYLGDGHFGARLCWDEVLCWGYDEVTMSGWRTRSFCVCDFLFLLVLVR